LYSENSKLFIRAEEEGTITGLRTNNLKKRELAWGEGPYMRHLKKGKMVRSGEFHTDL